MKAVMFYKVGGSLKIITIITFLGLGFVPQALSTQLTSGLTSDKQPLDNFSTSYSLVYQFLSEHSKIVPQAGVFSASQGKAQTIGANGLASNHFTVFHQQAQNALLGLGYFIDGVNQDRFSIMFGLNALYFSPTIVKGSIIKKQSLPNLAYRYSLTHYPIYMATKALINLNSDKFTLTVDLGLGPNIIQTSDFNERSLDGGVTSPDNSFSCHTSIAFSGMVGIGIKFKALGGVPMELGYRFFYLGQGQLYKRNPQLTSTLKTGYNYANALLISVFI
jgi:hypothetical protein